MRIAIITGASSGLGKAYAQQLDRLGHEVVLVDENPANLALLDETLALKQVIHRGVSVY